MASSSRIEEVEKLPGGYLVTPRVPQGLAAAVEGLTREVIRHSPNDIYVFAAEHFEKLLLLREQCGGVEGPTEREDNLRTLREMSQALRMREIDRGNVRSTTDQMGWSLNQTAKVLKRHRSIFGDAEEERRRNTSADQIFRMATSEKENRRRRGRSPKTPRERSNDVWKASTSRTGQGSSSTPPTPPLTRSGPKIITHQSTTGMLAKDIKTELRKNRMSSRERKNVGSKAAEDGKQMGKNVSSAKKLSERQKLMERELMKEKRKTKDSDGSSKEHKEEKLIESRALSMDRMKDYVVQRFATTKSLEELQSINYVEKVQGIIEETGPIIKEKIEELKSGMIGRSKRSSWFASARNDRRVSKDSPLPSPDNDYRSNPKDSAGDELETRLTETQNLLENVSSSLSRSRCRSRSAQSSPNSSTTRSTASNGLETRLGKTRNLLQDISSTLSSQPTRRSSSAAKSLGRHEQQSSDVVNNLGTRGDALESRLDETTNLLREISGTFALDTGNRLGSSKGSTNGSSEVSSSLPAVKSSSMKSCPGSVSRSDSDNLVLPVISPELPKSAKVKEELVLPILSPPGSAGSSIEATDVYLPELDITEDRVPEAAPVQDFCRDSLNVTPDFDAVPQRPDSLEPQVLDEDVDEPPARDSLPLIDHLQAKLREIRKLDGDAIPAMSSIKDDKREKTEQDFNAMRIDRSVKASPDNLRYTYVLTEGSPCEIPDSVTTVVIRPERAIESPDRSNDDSRTKSGIIDAEAIIENMNKIEPANDMLKSRADNPFGEYVAPESIDEPMASPPHIRDFMNAIDNRHDMQIQRHQELARISEEPSEQVQALEEPPGKDEPSLVKIVEKTDKIEQDIEGDNVDKSMEKTDSDLSAPGASSGLAELDSAESSNETKESSAADDEPLESAKCANSLDEEIMSSDAPSPESSNEVKETTLTDGLSLSLDPARPHVPELNLDSLRDISVSSFKITEDEYDNRELGESAENTNSITDTLTSDEKDRLMTEGPDFYRQQQQPADEENAKVLQDTIENSLIEVDQDICEKSSAWLTGSPSNVNNNENGAEANAQSENNYENSEMDIFLAEELNIEGEQEILEEDEKLEATKLDEDSAKNETIFEEQETKEAKFTKNLELRRDIQEICEPTQVKKFDEETQENRDEEEIEAGFLEGESPPAVSRSASQCTTRRVSSGNLIRLGEDPTEQTLQSVVDTDEEDSIGISRVKFATIGGETIKGQASDEIIADNSCKNESLESTDNNAKEYHIYVPDVDPSEDTTTTTESTATFDSAVTKIQAGVRGFLTRRRLHRGQNRSSTLSSIPSIQDSIVIEPCRMSEQVAADAETAGGQVSSKSDAAEDAATRIQSNYRGYKARKRLRREDAVQRTTLSLELSLTDSGLRHTGEFHDCVPLAIHDTVHDEKVSRSPDCQNNARIDNADRSSKNIFYDDGLVQLVDLIVLAKADEAAALQSGYLNFITSVEDTEALDAAAVAAAATAHLAKSISNDESFKESLTSAPVGLLIEEVTDSGAEAFMNVEQHDDSDCSLPRSESQIVTVDNRRVSQTSVMSIPGKTDNVREEPLPEKESLADIAMLGPETRVDSMEFPLVAEERVSPDSPDSSKPTLQVTLTPGDLMKSMSLSQESQLAEERIESPITMVQQMAPERSGSLRREDVNEKLASPKLHK